MHTVALSVTDARPSYYLRLCRGIFDFLHRRRPRMLSSYFISLFDIWTAGESEMALAPGALRDHVDVISPIDVLQPSRCKLRTMASQVMRDDPDISCGDSSEVFHPSIRSSVLPNWRPTFSGLCISVMWTRLLVPCMAPLDSRHPTPCPYIENGEDRSPPRHASTCLATYARTYVTTTRRSGSSPSECVVTSGSSSNAR